MKDQLEEILSTSDTTSYITTDHLELEPMGPRIIQAHRKLGLEKSSTDD